MRKVSKSIPKLHYIFNFSSFSLKPLYRRKKLKFKSTEGNLQTFITFNPQIESSESPSLILARYLYRRNAIFRNQISTKKLSFKPVHNDKERIHHGGYNLD